MTVNIVADSLAEAAPLILKALRVTLTDVQVFIEPEFQGYWAQLKHSPKKADEMTARELMREMRMYKNPQPYDVQLVPWPAWMYRGIDKGERSSAF